jgi:siroheme synthase-like protein
MADLAGRRVLVVGGGTVAQRKIEALLAANADVVVVASKANPAVQSWSDQNRLVLHGRPYQTGDVDQAWLVIAATENSSINTQIKAHCDSKRIFCNVVDVPDLCSFQVPAVIKRGELQITISTGGACPFLAKYLKNRGEQMLPAELEILVQTLGNLRLHWQKRFPQNPTARKEALEAFLATEAIDKFFKKEYSAFHQLVEQAMAAS